jgi:F-type H+-transporting ATPase subunit delta
MAGAATTVARPYAEAIFERANESNQLKSWSQMLAFLKIVVTDEAMADIIANPLFERQRLIELIMEIGGDRLTEEAGNLVTILSENGRLQLLPEICELFERQKADSERTIEVEVRSAYKLKPAESKALAAALKERLGRDVTITSELDPELIGGVHIRAGDLVIDGSIRGKLEQLATELKT